MTYKAALHNGIPLTGTNVDYILEGVNKYLMSLAKEQIRLAFLQSQKEKLAAFVAKEQRKELRQPG